MVSVIQSSKNCAESNRSNKKDFFWNEISESDRSNRKLQCIGWNKITIPKDKGGLGLVDVNLKNVALLSKWWWNLNQDKQSWWCKVIHGKYGQGMFINKQASVGSIKQFSPIIQSILSIAKDVKFSSLFSKNMIWTVKDGNSIYFWHDLWHTTEALSR